MLYVAAVAYLVISVIIGFRVVSISSRGPLAAGALWMFSPLPLLAVWYRHRPDLRREALRSERSRARLAGRLRRAGPLK
ncbi:MAG: hypothetical protein R3F49_05635 [Planctomycetota bacterium]